MHTPRGDRLPSASADDGIEGATLGVPSVIRQSRRNEDRPLAHGDVNVNALALLGNRRSNSPLMKQTCCWKSAETSTITEQDQMRTAKSVDESGD